MVLAPKFIILMKVDMIGIRHDIWKWGLQSYNSPFGQV